MSDLSSLLSRSMTPRNPQNDSLDWGLRVAQAQTPEGYEIPGSYAVIRTDTNRPIGSVGGRWTPIQPSELSELAIAIGEKSGCRNSEIKVMDEGRDIIIRMKGEEYTVGNDTLRKDTIVTCNNVGKSPVRAAASVYRKVCSNGLFLSTGTGQEWVSIRHTKSGPERVREIIRMGNALKEAHETHTETFLRLMMRPVSYKSGGVRDYYERLMPYPKLSSDATSDDRENFEKETAKIKNIRREWLTTFLQELDARDSGNPIGPNAWLAMNSVTKWAQHSMRVVRDNPEKREYNNLPGGKGYELTQAAYNEARSMFL